MKKNILDLAKQFIAIKSISETPNALEEILNLALSQVNNFTTEKFTKNGSVSALIYNTKKRQKSFKVILNGHLDVIPGKDHQYKPKVRDEKLYGVGAMDMKASVACMIQVFKNIAKKVEYPLALQLVTDEQTGGLYGTKYQIDKGIRADFVIAGETTNFNIVHKAKGILWLDITAKGKTSHSAYPWQGENAIMEMNIFLNRLQKKYHRPQKQVWKTTVSVSKIATTNTAFNKIPDDCMVSLDIRYLPEEKQSILNDLKKIIPQNFSYKIVFEQAPLNVDSNNPYIQELQKIATETLKQEISLYGAQGTSDVTYYSAVGCSGVEFGPIGTTGNTSNEYIDIPSLEMYYQILTRFLLSLN